MGVSSCGQIGGNASVNRTIASIGKDINMASGHLRMLQRLDRRVKPANGEFVVCVTGFAILAL